MDIVVTDVETAAAYYGAGTIGRMYLDGVAVAMNVSGTMRMTDDAFITAYGTKAMQLMLNEPETEV